MSSPFAVNFLCSLSHKRRRVLKLELRHVWLCYVSFFKTQVGIIFHPRVSYSRKFLFLTYSFPCVQKEPVCCAHLNKLLKAAAVNCTFIGRSVFSSIPLFFLTEPSFVCTYDDLCVWASVFASPLCSIGPIGSSAFRQGYLIHFFILVCLMSVYQELFHMLRPMCPVFHCSALVFLL